MDRDRANRLRTAIGVPLAAFVVLLYAAPVWMLTRLTGGRVDVSWASYTDEFREARLPLLIAAMSAHLVLFVAVAVRGRWHTSTRSIDIGLGVAIVALMVWFILDGPIFKSPLVNDLAKQWLGLPVLIAAPIVAYQIYREFVRPRAGRVAQH
jgi:hypothetical protein